MRSGLVEKSNSRHLSDVLPMLAMRIFTFKSLQPFAEAGEAFVRARDDLDADHLPHLGGGGGAGVGGGFHGRDVAAEKSGDVAAADLFPAGERDVGRFEGGVTGFEQSAEAFAFNHSNCLLSHKFVES